jgi:3-hydroxy-3-methylglutaryl CoA synthase
MVQKCFYHLILHDIKTQPHLYPHQVHEALKGCKAPLKSDDPAVVKVLQTHFGSDWAGRCERNLYLAKNLGNIYTGSLYNGLLSLL